MRRRTGRWVGLALLSSAASAAAAGACPTEPEILSRIAALGLERGSCKARFGVEFPDRLCAKAARKVGRPVSDREGDQGFAAAVLPLPAADVWRSLNDEDHHALDGKYVPVVYSEVIGGTPRGAERLLFQAYRQMGLGRWWVVRVHMNRALYEVSGGALWELYWENETDRADATRPPISRFAPELAPIRASRGAWLIAPLGDHCTFVEHFSWSDPGGPAATLQPLVIGGALRNTVDAIARLAREHVTAAHPAGAFMLPDGSPL